MRYGGQLKRRSATVNDRPPVSPARQSPARVTGQVKPRRINLWRSMPNTKLPKLSAINIMVAVALLAALVAAGWFYHRYQDTKGQLKQNHVVTPQQQQANQQKIAQVTGEVRQLTSLPQGETPSLAQITDINKLKNQPFFADARNGDYVLIYTQAKKAYLYRPSSKQIINIAPVTLGGNSQSTAGTSGN